MEVDQRDSALGLVPRVQADKLPSYQGKRVSVVGKVVNRQPGHLTLQVAGTQTVTATLLGVDEGSILLNQVYELVGTASADGSLVDAQPPVQYSDNFDLSAYYSAVALTHDPRFSHMFWGV
jgi:hypothetical protein